DHAPEIRVWRPLEREAMHADALCDETLGEMASGESGDAGDEHPPRHLRTLRPRDSAHRTRDEETVLPRHGQREIETVDLPRELPIAPREPGRPSLRGVIALETDGRHRRAPTVDERGEIARACDIFVCLFGASVAHRDDRDVVRGTQVAHRRLRDDE